MVSCYRKNKDQYQVHRIRLFKGQYTKQYVSCHSTYRNMIQSKNPITYFVCERTKIASRLTLLKSVFKPKHNVHTARSESWIKDAFSLIRLL